MSRCLARLVDDKVRGKFKDGHHFHIEVRCAKLVKEGCSLCEKCEGRPRDEPKNHPSALHGLIGQEIPAWSHIFGSAWYLSKVGKYGTPSEEEMARAKKAVEDNSLAVAEAKAKEGVAAAPEKKEPKPRKFKVAASAAVVVPVVEAPAVPVVQAPAPVAPKQKRKAKTVVVAPPPVSLVEVKAIESKEPILKISDDDLLIITIRKFEHNGRSYFLASGKDKLYSIGKDGQPLNYVGRYNRQSDTIDADFPDSDEEY